MRKLNTNYFCLAALLFALTSLVLLTLTRQNANRIRKLELTAAEVIRIDAENDPEKAISGYNRIASDTPLIGIRIMRRRWRQLLVLRKQIKTVAAANPNREPDQLKTLRQEFDRLRFSLQESGAALIKTRPEPKIAWRVHNLLGATYLLQAADILDRGKSPQQGRAALNLALKNFRQAITEIDQDQAARKFDNIPRWNLELLAAGKTRAAISQTPAGDEGRLDLKKNLSTMLPESAGYMVGEPPDNRVRK